MAKYLDNNGLVYLWSKIKSLFVAKEEGKGLSSNDFTTAEKEKLKNVAENANNYTHPAHAAKASGLYKVTVDNQGHVSAATAVVKKDITDLGIPESDTVYTLPDATATVKGGVKIGANINVTASTISVPNATTSAKGAVQLTDGVASTSTTTAATPAAVKKAYDLANSKQSPATSLSGYGITDAYTKTEIDGKGWQTSAQVQALIANASHLKREKVTTLPDVTKADPNTIYMMPKTGSNGDVFNEYMLIDGAFELIGSSEADLTDYLQKSDVTSITNTEIDGIVAS